MKCFFHTDMDGKCAGAIVAKAYPHAQGEYLPINYNQPFPFDKIERDETVVIVDFSLQKEGEFERLLEITPSVIWIDHHKTAIEKYAHLEDRILGIRRDGVSGCELTWEYFYLLIPFSNQAPPEVVKLLGDYDIWAFQYGEYTNRLQVGIRLYNTHPLSPDWDRWLSSDYIPTKEMEEGKIALKYRNSQYAGLIKAWSFPTTFEGYRAIACNAGSVSSQLFDTVGGDYDLLIPFVFDGSQWTVSLYTREDEIDVSEIAKKYGGGGHKGAAGFQCKVLPFSGE